MQITGANPVLAVHALDASATWFGEVLGCPDGHRFMLGEAIGR